MEGGGGRFRDIFGNRVLNLGGTENVENVVPPSETRFVQGEGVRKL